MKLKDLGEFPLIDRLTDILKIKDPSVIVGFGDDCSCVEIGKERIVFTSDIQLEERHFLKDFISATDLGWRAVSVNVSDVVACGGVPKWGFISVGFPKDLEFEWVKRLYEGIQEACDFYGFSIIGGNTTSSDRIFIDLFLVGKTDRFVPRSGAKEKELVVVCGFLGNSRAGLEILLDKKNKLKKYEKKLVGSFIKPVVNLDLSKKLSKFASSSIDISDGLVADIYHLSKQSKVKIVIDKEKIPLSKELLDYCSKTGKNPYDYALYGGEEYKVVFTIKEKDLQHFKNCFVIGKVEKGEGVYLKEGKALKLLPQKGFSHL